MLPVDNRESWRAARALIEECSDDEYWSSWKRMALSVVSDLEKRGLDSAFRVGMSMHHILFSTLDHHGLENGQPRIVFEIESRKGVARIAYTNRFDIDQKFVETVDVGVAAEKLIEYLRRLWVETKGGEEVPHGLGSNRN